MSEESSITVEQWQEKSDGSFQAVVRFDEPGTFTISVYPEVKLTNGLPQIVGYAYPASEYGSDGKLHDESECVDCVDADVVEVRGLG